MHTLRTILAGLLVTLSMLAGTLAFSAWWARNYLNQSEATINSLTTHRLQNQLTTELESQNPALASTSAKVTSAVKSALSSPQVSAAFDKSSTAGIAALYQTLSAQSPTLATAVKEHPPSISLLTAAEKRVNQDIGRVIDIGLWICLALLVAGLIIHAHRSAVLRRVGRRTIYLAAGGLVVAWLIPYLISSSVHIPWIHSLAADMLSASRPGHVLMILLLSVGTVVLAIGHIWDYSRGTFTPSRR